MVLQINSHRCPAVQGNRGCNAIRPFGRQDMNRNDYNFWDQSFSNHTGAAVEVFGLTSICDRRISIWIRGYHMSTTCVQDICWTIVETPTRCGDIADKGASLVDRHVRQAYDSLDESEGDEGCEGQPEEIGIHERG